MVDHFKSSADGTIYAMSERVIIAVRNPYGRAAMHDDAETQAFIFCTYPGTTWVDFTETHCHINGYGPLLALPALSTATIETENNHSCKCTCDSCAAYEAYADWYMMQPFSVRVAQPAY